MRVVVGKPFDVAPPSVTAKDSPDPPKSPLVGCALRWQWLLADCAWPKLHDTVVLQSSCTPSVLCLVELTTNALHCRCGRASFPKLPLQHKLASNALRRNCHGHADEVDHTVTEELLSCNDRRLPDGDKVLVTKYLTGNARRRRRESPILGDLEDQHAIVCCLEASSWTLLVCW